MFCTIDYACLHSFLSFLCHSFLKLLGRNCSKQLLDSSPNFHICCKPRAMQSHRIVCETVYFCIHPCWGPHALLLCMCMSVIDQYGKQKCGTLCWLVPRRVLTNTFHTFHKTCHILARICATDFILVSVGIIPFCTFIMFEIYTFLGQP